MVTQACNLPGRIPGGPIYVQRQDGSAYCEGDEEEIGRMVRACVVEGIGPRSGVIRRLRIICTESEAIEKLSAIRATEPRITETPGSITSMASQEVYRQPLDTGYFVWQHKRNRGLRLFGESVTADAYATA